MKNPLPQDIHALAPSSGLSSFADLRVVELGVWIAAPSATALLADWGAEVIKIEAPAGDPMRYVFGSIGLRQDFPNPVFAMDNRGKRSVVLNLRDHEERQILDKLLETADVFITNLRPDALDALGLEPESTVARHPHLVYGSVSGYGLQGDERNRPSYDLGAFWARSGLSSQLADADGTPLNARGGIGDHVTALAIVSGVLAALFDQRQTGKGRVVEVSLLRTGAYLLGWDLGIQMAVGKVSGSEPRDRTQMPLMNCYRTSDGRWLFITGLEADRHLAPLCRALGRPDLLDDPRFANAAALRKNRREVIAVLDEIIGQATLEHWAAALDREGVFWSPAQSPADVVEDVQLDANEGFLDIVSSSGRVVRSVSGPIKFPGMSPPARRSFPELGEHTAEVLQELSDLNL